MVENESQFYINTYTSLNNTSDSGSCWIFRFGARGMFLGYEMFENFDWARDDTSLVLKVLERKKKVYLHFCCLYVTTFCEQSTFIKKKKKL